MYNECAKFQIFLSDENTFFELDGSDGHGSSSARPAVQQPPNKQLRLLQFSSNAPMLDAACLLPREVLPLFSSMRCST
jgi:hypothetical protein